MAKPNKTDIAPADLLAAYSYTPDHAKAAEAAMTGGAEGVGWVRPSKYTELTVRIVPPVDPTASPWHSRWRHFYKDDDGGWVSYTCPQKTSHGRCPDCVQAGRLRNSDVKAEKDLGFELSANHEIVVNVIVRGEEDQGVRPLVLSAPAGKAQGKTQYEKLTAAIGHKRFGGDPLNPRAGRDIVITKVGAGTVSGTSYTIQLDPQDSALASTDEQALEWIRGQPDLAAQALEDAKAGVEYVSQMIQDSPLAQRAQVVSGPPARALPVGNPTAEDDMHEGWG